MKIWLDLTNSPHVNYFKPFINNWKKEGCQVIITTRNLANTIDLINQNGWDYEEIGGHAGRNKIKKMLFFFKRIALLYRFLKSEHPNIGVSQSSFYSPIVCRFLKIPSIYMNDNEHAKGNLIAFKFATLNLLPESLRDLSNNLGWSDKYDIEFYAGIKEGIYLSQLDISKKRKDQAPLKSIYIRLEPNTAQYYSGRTHFMDDFIITLKNKYKIIILPRNADQIQYYKSERFKNVRVCEYPMNLEQIYSDCSLFIGAGGSMTRELAFLNIPTLCVYQDNLLEVDKLLIDKRLMYYSSNPTLNDIEMILNGRKKIETHELFSKGSDAFNLINSKIMMYAKN